MGLGTEVIEVNLVDDATHTAMNLAGRGCGIVPVAHADDSNATMFKSANNALLLDHVARETVQTLHQQDIEVTSVGIGKHARAARATIYRCRTRYGLVTVFSHYLPTFSLNARGANSYLIVARCVALFVGGEAG